MHELSVAHAVVSTVVAALPTPTTRVLEVHVRVGGLSGVVPEALGFSYDVATQGTPLAGSALVVERVPILVHCAQCGRDGELENAYDFRCPHCGELTGDVRSGKELEVSSIVLEDDDDEGEDEDDAVPEDAPALAGGAG